MDDIREEVKERIAESYRRTERDLIMEDFEGERQILVNQVTILKALDELLFNRNRHLMN